MRTFASIFVLLLASAAAHADDCADLRAARPRATALARADPDAATLAAIAQNTAVASTLLFDRVRRELARIRAALPPGRRSPIVPTPGRWMFTVMDEGALDRARSGDWAEWNCLVDAVQARTQFDSVGASLWLPQGLNPYRVHAAFSALPGVMVPDLAEYYGLRDVVTTAGCGTRYSYFVRLGAGDCQAGCITEDFWWFASGANQRLRVVDVAPDALPYPSWVQRVQGFEFGEPVECGLPDDR